MTPGIAATERGCKCSCHDYPPMLCHDSPACCREAWLAKTAGW